MTLLVLIPLPGDPPLPWPVVLVKSDPRFELSLPLSICRLARSAIAYSCLRQTLERQTFGAHKRSRREQNRWLYTRRRIASSGTNAGAMSFHNQGFYFRRRKVVLKTTMAAAFALMMAASLPVSAQTSSSGTAAAPAGKVSATHVQPGQIRATEMDGSTVYDTQNQKVG